MFDIFEGDYIISRANCHDFHIEVHRNLLFSTDVGILCLSYLLTSR